MGTGTNMQLFKPRLFLPHLPVKRAVNMELNCLVRLIYIFTLWCLIVFITSLCCFTDLGTKVYAVVSGGAGNASTDSQKALPVWKPQNPRRSSRKQNGAFFRWGHSWFWVIRGLPEELILKCYSTAEICGICRGLTFAEHLRLAHQFAFFLLHSSGSRVWEPHQVLSHHSALHSHVSKAQRSRRGLAGGGGQHF